ncbi:MAG: hypothetical protein WC728_10120 [Elusimicrobiota bacterium]
MRRIFCRSKLLPAAFTLAACLLLPRSAGAAITFTDQNTNIFSSMTAHAVIKTSTTYRMYMTSESYKIVSATSTDLVSWSLEPGVRISTSATADIDSSSITSCGIILATSAASGYLYRMFYVGISSVGAYSVLSATSADGLTWSKESGVRLQVSTGSGFVGSPKPFQTDSSTVRLFYVADNAGANSPENFRIYTASSTDGGVTLSTEGLTLSDKAYGVWVTTLTDARTRLYYSAPLTGGTTGSQVLSAISTDGKTFTAESGVRFSTPSASASLSDPVVVRATSTESYRWHMFMTYVQAGSTLPYVTRAYGLQPLLLTSSPARVLKSAGVTAFTMTGEVLSASSQVTFYQVGSTITAAVTSSANDLQLAGTFDPSNHGLGFYNAVVTNPGGTTSSLANALYIDVPAGTITLTDNLFRPLRGGTVRISIQTFNDGPLTVKLYTSDGGYISTLYDGYMPAGVQNLVWDGKTTLGNTVASGVYLLWVRGEKLSVTEKIVVIK